MRARALFTAAASAYVANCALGTAVGFGIIDTSQMRWVHHALYIVTATVTAVAAVSGLATPHGGLARAAFALAPAAVPLGAIPFVGTHGRRHALVALSAAPFFTAALIRAWR